MNLKVTSVSHLPEVTFKFIVGEGMVDVNDLYYDCIDRIDPVNLDNAEEYLIGCVTFLKRKECGRADRDRVREDIILNRGLEKYARELAIISRLSDEALSTLIASSIDLSSEVKRAMALYERIKTSSIVTSDSKSQATKAKKASDMLARIAIILSVDEHQKPKKSNHKSNHKSKHHSIVTPSLFDGVE